MIGKERDRKTIKREMVLQLDTETERLRRRKEHKDRETMMNI
jgi:hypothetical protein